MIKLKYFITTFILLLIVAVPCSAKSLLTYFDTVVIECGEDVSRDAVLQSVVTEAEGAKQNFIINSSKESNETYSSVRSIMKLASESFFQK